MFPQTTENHTYNRDTHILLTRELPRSFYGGREGTEEVVVAVTIWDTADGRQRVTAEDGQGNLCAVMPDGSRPGSGWKHAPYNDRGVELAAPRAYSKGYIRRLERAAEKAHAAGECE